MLFTRKRKNVFNPELKLNDKPLIYAESHKFLGIKFDVKLNWKKHITEIKPKSFKNLNLLKMLSNSNFGLDRKL